MAISALKSMVSAFQRVFVFHRNATLSIGAATAFMRRIDSEGAVGLHIRQASLLSSAFTQCTANWNEVLRSSNDAILTSLIRG